MIFSHSQHSDFAQPLVSGVMSELEQPSELNLAGKVRRTNKFYIKNGEFSDLWVGEWVEDTTNQHRSGAKVAIKQLRGAPAHNRDLHEKTTKKLNKSGLEWIKLNHNNVLKFYGIVYDMGFLPAMITPYCEIGNILEYLNKSETRPNISHILMLILGISSGLQYLHANSVIHGDLRAANVLIDNNNLPVIADFGLTFVIDHGEFTTNKIAGPARWTAPEILDPPGEEENEPPYSQASDIFAFGMTMIEILTGKPPYGKIRNDSAVIFRIIKGERPEMPESIENLDDIKDLISWTWKKDPKDRPSAAQVWQSLEKHVHGDSVETSGSYNPFRFAMFYIRRFFGDYDSGGAI